MHLFKRYGEAKTELRQVQYRSIMARLSIQIEHIFKLSGKHGCAVATVKWVIPK